jgi:hypothetical protein
MARIGRLRGRRLLRRAAEDALAGRTLEQLLGAPTDSSRHPNARPTPRTTAYPQAVAHAGIVDNVRGPGTNQNTSTAPEFRDPAIAHETNPTQRGENTRDDADFELVCKGSDNRTGSNYPERIAAPSTSLGWRDDPYGETPGDPYRIPNGDDVPSRADDVFGGLLVAPWMFSMRARPWYRTRPAAIVFVCAAAAVVISGVLLAFRTPTTAIEKSTTVATTPSARATPPTRATPPASSEPTTSSIPPSPPIAPPPSPASAQPIDREPAIAGPGSLEEPPPAEPIDPEPAIADVGPPEEPPPAEPIGPEP